MKSLFSKYPAAYLNSISSTIDNLEKKHNRKLTEFERSLVFEGLNTGFTVGNNAVLDALDKSGINYENIRY